MTLHSSRAARAIVLLTLAAPLPASVAWAQEVPAAPPAIVKPAPQAMVPTLGLAARREVFNIVWSKVNDSYYDPNFGGLNWKAVKTKYAPKVDTATSDGAFYAALNDMLGELKQSHFGIIPPEAAIAEAEIKAAATNTGGSAVVPVPTAPTNPDNPANPTTAVVPVGGPGTTGLTVQLVEGAPTITRVVPGSGAEAAGLKPGFVLTEIGGRAITGFLDALKKRGKTDRAFATFVRLGVESVLSGTSGTTVTLGYKDADDKPQTATVLRSPVAGVPEKFGQLPTLWVNVEQKRLDNNIGYVGFNIFLMPIKDPVMKAIKEYSDAPGIIIDVRGNPGGLGALAGTVARSFYTKEINLGTMRTRNGFNSFLVNPVASPYSGPVVILTDEGSASTSEILAAGMKESGRAVTIGATTAGQALPSQIERLPYGVRLQYAIADLKTPSGKMIEGDGVTPTIPVTLTRRDLLTGRDPILDAAVKYINAEAAKTRPAAP